MPHLDRFKDRTHAGRVLAQRLEHYGSRNDVLVLALPRGGVPVAYPIAAALDAPLDVFLVRKLGAPGHEELAMGAIAAGGARVINHDVVQLLKIPKAAIERAVRREEEEIARRQREYRGTKPFPDVRNRTVILVDDGLATGATMRAAAQALRQLDARRIVVAVPVGAADTCRELEDLVDETICAFTPEPFGAVGRFYDDFDQTTDEEVQELLRRAAGETAKTPRD